MAKKRITRKVHVSVMEYVPNGNFSISKKFNSEEIKKIMILTKELSNNSTSQLSITFADDYQIKHNNDLIAGIVTRRRNSEPIIKNNKNGELRNIIYDRENESLVELSCFIVDPETGIFLWAHSKYVCGILGLQSSFNESLINYDDNSFSSTQEDRKLHLSLLMDKGFYSKFHKMDKVNTLFLKVKLTNEDKSKIMQEEGYSDGEIMKKIGMDYFSSIDSDYIEIKNSINRRFKKQGLRTLNKSFIQKLWSILQPFPQSQQFYIEGEINQSNTKLDFIKELLSYELKINYDSEQPETMIKELINSLEKLYFTNKEDFIENYYGIYAKKR
jgi:hypothetical protein